MHDEAHGRSTVEGYTYAAVDIAKVLIACAKGESFAKASIGVRREMRRARLAPRPTTRRRAMAPRQVRDPANRRPAQRRDYDYTSAKPFKTLDVRVSRNGTLAQSYIDAFAPVVLEQYTATEWPASVVIDSLPLKRRGIEAAEALGGRVGRKAGGVRQGEVWVAADGTTTPGTPIIAGVQGGKDQLSAERFLRSLRTNPERPPVWVVADLDNAIWAAVQKVWPTAIHYRCENHLKVRLRLALEEDGIPALVPVDDPDATPRGTAGMKFSGAFVEHRLHHMVRSCFWDETRWTAFIAATQAAIPPSFSATRDWIAQWGDTILRQIEFRREYPDMPRATGAVEGTIGRIKGIVGSRSEYFRNAARLEKLVNLVRLDAVGALDETTVANLVTRHLLGRERRDVMVSGQSANLGRPRRSTSVPAGIDWVSGRDVYGTSSIDALVDEAMAANAVRITMRDKANARRKELQRIANQAAAAASAGITNVPISRGRRSLDPMYSQSRVGRFISDYPELAAEYLPELNGGVPATSVRAASSVPVMWRCAEHWRDDGTGHYHEWTAPPEARTRGARCPVYANRQACAWTCLRAQSPALAAEFDMARNGSWTPDNLRANSNRPIVWICPRGHEPYKQEVHLRFRRGLGCPRCYEIDMADRRRVRNNAYGADIRAIAARRRPVVRPPKADHEIIGASGAVVSTLEAGRLLRRTHQTVRNWIREGRLAGELREKGFVVPIEEIARVRELLGMGPPEAELADAARRAGDR